MSTKLCSPQTFPELITEPAATFFLATPAAARYSFSDISRL